MSWFLIALLNPVLHAFANHFDKFLLSKYLKGATVGSLILFSALFSVVVLPIIFVIHPNVFSSLSFSQAVILMGNGIFLTLAVLLYLYAIDSDEASYVAPFFQLIPVFGFLFGFLILGEVLTTHQILAGGLILIGSLLLSLELSGKNTRIKKKLVLLMIGSSFFYSINAVVFKSIAISQGFLDSLFWDMSGKFLFGVVLFIIIRPYRTQFLNLLKVGGARFLGLNILDEIMGLLGEIALVFAVLFAPVALVQSVGGLQPAFVLFFGIIITIFFPKFGIESLQKKFMIQKIIGIVIITVGVYLLQLFQV